MTNIEDEIRAIVRTEVAAYLAEACEECSHKPAAASARLMYSIPETSELLGISRTTVYQLIQRGELHAIEVGTGGRARLRIRAKDLSDFVEDRRRTGGRS